MTGPGQKPGRSHSNSGPPALTQGADEFSTSDLRRKSVRGGASTVAGQAARLGLRIGTISVLARLLTPADFGLIAMVNVVVGFVAMFKDAGLSMATVQQQEVSHEQVSTLFWINVLFGLVLAGVVAGFAPLVAGFYGEPRLAGITVALAATLLLGGLTVQHQALLKREMRFQALALIDVLSMACGSLAGITMAAVDCGYWSLVGMAVTTQAAHAALVWGAMAWRPGWPHRHVGVRRMLGFGGNLVGASFLNYIGKSASSVMIGRSWGAVSLAFYDKAQQLLTMPVAQVNAPIAAVAVPGLCRLQQDPERFRSYFCKGFSIIMCFTIPVVTILCVFAEEAVWVLLGPQWEDTAILFRLLGVATLAIAVANPTGWLLVASGRTDRSLRMALVTTPLTLGAFTLGLPHGPEGVATAYSTVTLLLVVPCYAYATRGTSIRLADIGAAVGKPLLAGAASGACGYLVLLAVGTGAPILLRFLLGGCICLAVYFTILLVGFRQWRFYLALMDDLGLPGFQRISRRFCGIRGAQRSRT